MNTISLQPWSALLLTISITFICATCSHPAPEPTLVKELITPKSTRITSDSQWQHLFEKSMNSVILHNQFFMEANYDSCYSYVQQLEPQLILDLLEYKFDSNLVLMYGSIYSAIGNNQTLMGDPENGLVSLLKGYHISQDRLKESDPQHVDYCVALAANYSIRGDYENAIYWQQKGLQLIRKHQPGSPYEGNWYWNTAFFRSQQGDYESALENYKKAAAIYEQGYPPVFPSSCERIGDACVRLGYYDEALDWFQRGLKSADQLPDARVDIAMINIGLAARSLALQQPSQAEVFMQKAQKGMNHPDMPGFLISEYYTQFAKFAEYRGKFAEAITYLHRAIANNNFRHVVRCYDVLSQAQGYVQNIDVQNHLVELYQKAGQPDSALQTVQRVFMESALEFSPASPYDNPEVDLLPHSTFLISTLHQKARILEKEFEKNRRSETLQATLETYRLGIAFIDKLNRNLKWDNSKYTLLDRAVPLYEDAISFLLEIAEQQKNTRYAEEAWVLADKCKAVTLLEKLDDLREKRFSGMPDSFLKYEKELHCDIAFLEHQVMAEKNNQGEIGVQKLVDYKSRLLSAKNRHDSLLSTIQINNEDFYRLKFSNTPVSWAQLQSKVLKPKTALLEFFVGDSTIYVFFVSSEGIRCHREKSDSELVSALQQLKSVHENKQDNHFRQFVQSARIVYNRLLAPVAQTKEPLEKLIIIPDGPLGYLPFQLLLERDIDAATMTTEDWRSLPYLMKTKNIRYEYSAALLLSKDPPKMREKFYVGFAPAFSGQALSSRGIDSVLISRNWLDGLVPDLRNNRPEVQAIGNLTKGQCYLSDAATEQSFKKNAPGNGVIHLATHACTDDNDPLYSQILFSQIPGDTTEDGSLHAYELYDMRLDADLAVLSACQTGAGKVQRGEGIMSLSRAFKYAGCPNIVMSLWNADDAASKDIMLLFFKNLKAGMGKDEALNQAQRDYLKNAPQEAAHPSHWATFVLVGDDAPVAFRSGKWLIALFTLGMVVLILYLFFWRRQA